ncbi:hypothetical protein F5B17DRAFT_419045 [Nemania serpens]|nr:hypothetical protein F5B17DRAFT_419045 [Nemania serpens]
MFLPPGVNWKVELFVAYSRLTEDEKRTFQGLACNPQVLRHKMIRFAWSEPEVPPAQQPGNAECPPPGFTVEEASRITGIFFTNFFALGNKGDLGGGLFHRLARINHSCVPNATVGKYCNVSGMLYLRALRDLLPGEEVLIGYGKHTRPYRERRASFSFVCRCALCSSPVRERRTSNARRREMRRFGRWLTDYVREIIQGHKTDHLDELGLKIAKAYLRRVESENLYSLLPQGLEALAFAHLQNGDLYRAEQAMRKAEEYERMYFGHMAKSMELFWNRVRVVAPQMYDVLQSGREKVGRRAVPCEE